MTNSNLFPVRNLRFAMDDQVPRHWHGGGRAVTLFFNNLSIFFPPGERFFVAAVSDHRRRLSDPALLAEVKAFCGQEGIHSREHVRYNRMLEAQGYPAQQMEARIARLLRVLGRVLPPRLRLSATCALEHFTATLAHGLLSDPAVLDGAHPVMTGLWTWHAAEENEHKAVAYDVYRQVGGNYPERVVTMLVTTFIFWLLVVGQQVRLMHADGILFSPREWVALARFLFVQPGLLAMWGLYLDYYRPTFHPWQLDNRDLLEQWKRAQASAA
jgi:predicted metal-dependent hydrolase